MKIRRISCNQFAGLNNFNKAFADGLNLIVGDNETGKSSISDLMFQVLFRTCDVNAKTDSDFFSRNFPRNRRGPDNVIVVDGTIVLEDDTQDPKREYTLTKQWSDQGKTKNNGLNRVTLIHPDGADYDEKIISSIMNKVLGYGEGTYREIVFSSQRERQFFMELLFEAKIEERAKYTLSSITDVLSAAGNEGKTITDVYNLIFEKYADYCNRWDMDANEPSNQTIKGKTRIGQIRECYDELKELKEKRESLVHKQEDVEKLNEEIISLNKEKEDKNSLFRTVEKNKSVLAELRSRKTNLDMEKGFQEKRLNAEKEWPLAEENAKQARLFEKRLDEAQTYDKYCAAVLLFEDLEQKKIKLDACMHVQLDDIKTIEKNERMIDKEKNKLKGINAELEIKIDDQDKYDLKLYSVNVNDEGDEISIDQNNIITDEKAKTIHGIKIDQATKIVIPDMFEMKIMPQDCDYKQIQLEIGKYSEVIDLVLKRYGVKSKQALEELEKDYQSSKRAYDDAESMFIKSLEGKTWETLKKERELLSPDVESKERVVVELKKSGLAKDENDLKNQKVIYEQRSKTYREEFGSIDELKKKIDVSRAKIDELERECEKIESSVPKGIENLDSEQLGDEIAALENQISLKNDDLTTARANVIKERPLADFDREISEKEEELTKEFEKGIMWKRILERFERCKAVYEQNKDVARIVDNFTEYITRLNPEAKVNSMKMDTVTLDIASGKNTLSYETLSNGNRESIEFAFRLAMLDEVFPDGNGFAVFDDPFVNMDPSRLEKACALLREFAKKNQVIFFTCDPKYEDIFKSANKIRMIDTTTT